MKFYTLTYPCILYLSLLSCKIGYSQSVNNLKYSFEISTYLSSSKQTPFWLRTNQYGIVPFQSQFMSLGAAVEKDYTTNPRGELKKTSFGYAINSVINLGKVNQILIPVAYFKVRHGVFELYAGRRKEIIGLTDSVLSSGSFAWSGNALPLPKIQVSIPNYTPILGKGLLSIKGSFSHGWFGEEYYLKNVYLHQKTLYGRVGKPHWKLKMYAGFNHQVQWGGKLNSISTLKYTSNNKFPQSFKDYLYVATGISLNATQKFVDTSNYSFFDLGNRVGNHLGSIDLGLTYNTNNLLFSLYRQSYYDDGSLFYLANIKDGLTGLTIRNKKNKKNQITALNFEVFNSQSQGGSLDYTQNNNFLRGRDDYFNHGQFLDGWSYNGLTIGNPFITPTSLVNPELPQLINYNISEVPITYFTNNNRVRAYIINILSKFSNTNILLKTSYSQNLGTYLSPFKKTINQYSIGVFTDTFLQKKQLSLITRIGYDNFALYQQSIGFSVGLKKVW